MRQFGGPHDAQYVPFPPGGVASDSGLKTYREGRPLPVPSAFRLGWERASLSLRLGFGLGSLATPLGGGPRS